MDVMFLKLLPTCAPSPGALIRDDLQITHHPIWDTDPPRLLFSFGGRAPGNPQPAHLRSC